MTTTQTSSEPAEAGRGSGRARRWGLDPAERRRVMDAVALRTEDGWGANFTVMMGLSVVVAVMGLSSDSAAVVIGAMLLAPLMTPVMGMAAALAMALSQHLLRSLLVVTSASVLSVAGAYAIAALLPDGPLPAEVLSRTSPDLRDLLVALAAGAAGAYATVRPDVSNSLPGVAVAVALVPPLATIGVSWEAGRPDLATGAALLYSANLTAIVLIGVLVFLLTGFVPPSRLKQKRGRVIGGGILVATATVAVAVPLTLASISAAEAARSREAARAAAESWLVGTGLELDAVRLEGDVVHIRLSGPEPPPPTLELKRSVRQMLGPPATVEVRWTQTQTPSDDPGDPDPSGGVPDLQQHRAAVREAVDAWMARSATAYTIDVVALDDDEIRIELSAVDPPPPIDGLAARISEEVGLTVPVVVDWRRRLSTGFRFGPADSIEEVHQQLQREADDWAADHDGFAVAELAFDGTRTTVDVLGPDPGPVPSLRAALQTVIGPDATVTIWFRPRHLVTADEDAPTSD